MSRLKGFCLCALLVFLHVPFLAMPSQSTAREGGSHITIAESKGDRGAPAPYLHHRNGPGYALMTFVFDTLLWRDSQGKLIPCLASSWEAQDGGKAFLFTIHPKARWHDGRVVTAEDVVFTVDYFNKHPYAFAKTSPITKASVEKGNKVRISFDKTYAPFLESIAVSMPILPKHIYKDVADPARFSDAEALTGSGPFKIAEYNGPQKLYRFKANSAYHRGSPWAKEVRVVGLKPPAAVKAALKGEVDMLTMVKPQQQEKLQEAGFSILQFPSTHPVRLKFNLEHPLFKDVEVRRAFARAINTKDLVDKAYQGEAEIWSAGGLHSLEKEAQPLMPQYPYDPKALEAIALPKEPLKLVADKRVAKVARVVAAQLKKQGVEVTLTVTDRGAANKALKKGDYHLALVTFSVLGDPVIFRDAETGSRVDGDHYHDNPELTALLEEQVWETNPEKRQTLVNQASLLYARDVPSYSMVSAIKTAAFNHKIRLVFPAKGLGRGIPVILDKDMFLSLDK